MTFLAIIIALLLQQARGPEEPLHRDEWFRKWRARFIPLGSSPVVKLALAVLLPVVAVQVVLGALEPVLFGLLWIGASVSLLLYAFGRGDFAAMAERYRHQCRDGDFESAFLTARDEFGWISAADDPGSAQEVAAVIGRGFLYEGYQRLFPVLFYCVLLGPAGALAYRLLQLCRGDFEPDLTGRCLFLADWVPVRLLAAAFALTGDFVGSRDQLVASFRDLERDAASVLYGVGTTAVENPGAGASCPGERAARQNEGFAGLLGRSAICWVVVLALLVVLL
jgi:AmpE protein